MLVIGFEGSANQTVVAPFFTLATKGKRTSSAAAMMRRWHERTGRSKEGSGAAPLQLPNLVDKARGADLTVDLPPSDSVSGS